MTTPTTSLREKLERHPDLSVDQYKAMVKWCRDAIDHNADFLYDKDLFDDAIASASRRFHLPPDSLISLLRNTHVWHVKIITRSVKAKLASHVDRYVRNGESMWHIAYSNRYPPCLLARAMLEVLLKPKNSFALGRKGLTEAMRDPVGKLGCATGIHDDYLSSEQFPGPPYNGIGDKPLTRLAREVLHVIAVDPMYGPDHDQARHTIGVEYERLLEQLLIDMGTSYESELHGGKHTLLWAEHSLTQVCTTTPHTHPHLHFVASRYSIRNRGSVTRTRHVQDTGRFAINAGGSTGEAIDR